ncbi:hypothetical protein Golomagni_07900 [Golovinomyces magnicellulatus]|nr:hypothetical protein Golomagni_07900 [Golovinomyces magnicellulatus]
MVYYCDNETVDGVEFPGFPKSLEPKGDGQDPIVVADMSSNILSRRIPVSNFSVIFFGAQKNLGSTGITVVIIKKNLLPPQTPQPSATLMRQMGLPIPPIILQYETIAKNNSLYNTLSIFDVYIAGQVLKNSLKTYSNRVAGQEAVSAAKAKAIYDALDAHADVYKIVPAKNVRSRMNICFRVQKGGDVDAAEKEFLKQSTALGLTGLKGHRSVGGIRASNFLSLKRELKSWPNLSMILQRLKCSLGAVYSTHKKQRHEQHESKDWDLNYINYNTPYKNYFILLIHWLKYQTLMCCCWFCDCVRCFHYIFGEDPLVTTRIFLPATD